MNKSLNFAQFQIPYYLLSNFLDTNGCCRWTTNADEPLLFVKYDGKLLNILDVERNTFILKSVVHLEDGGGEGN
mgnify:CR=1 FL=1